VKVAVDGRALRPGAVRERGVARYLRQLLEALGTAHPGDEYAVLVAGGSEPEPFRASGVRLVRTRLPGRVLFGAAALTGRPRLDRLVGGCDVAWVPAPSPVAVSGEVPLVLTVHDLAFEHRPADFSRYDRLWHALARSRSLAQRSARVVCVSRAVADAAIAEWGLDADRVRVVPSGPGRPAGSAEERPPAGRAAGLPDSFILCVGALEPRKLPLVLLDAHRRARARGLQAGLVFAGDGPLRPELARSGAAAVLGHVPDPVLEALYGRALAVACVSREEGFAFTPVEALARGTPAIVADQPVFAETVADGALRVPPGDAEALAAALLRIEREDGLRERLVAAGRAAVARLSWEEAARATRETLAEAAR
jgi:glycosyltransferase involved in cell wall biosynthesis